MERLRSRGEQRSAQRSASVHAVLIALAAGVSLQANAQETPPADRVQTVDHSIEGYVSDKALQMQYVRELRIEDVGPIEARAGVFYNEQRDLVAIIDGLMYLGDQGDRREIELSVGTRVFGAFLNTENEDTLGVGIGGEAEWFFNQRRRSSLKLSLFYAPDILTFGIADNIKDYGLRLQTRIREKTNVFVGYRSLEVDTHTTSRKLDDSVNIGFRRTF